MVFNLDHMLQFRFVLFEMMDLLLLLFLFLFYFYGQTETLCLAQLQFVKGQLQFKALQTFHSVKEIVI